MDTFELLEVIEEKLQNTINVLFWIGEDLERAEVEKKIIYPTEYKIKVNVVCDSFQYIREMIESEINKNKSIDISNCNTVVEELQELEKISKKGR